MSWRALLLAALLLAPATADAGASRKSSSSAELKKKRRAKRAKEKAAKAAAEQAAAEKAAAERAAAEAAEDEATLATQIDMVGDEPAPADKPTRVAQGEGEGEDSDQDEASAEPANPADAEAEVAQTPTVTASAPNVEGKPKALELSGYLMPALSVVHRGDAVPRDRWRYGAESTRAGIIFSGEPVSRWRYKFEVVLAGENNDLVTEVDTVDSNGDGVADDVAPMTSRLPGVWVERAIVEFDAGYGVTVVAGQHRIPFTVQEQSPSTQLMFPARSGPNEVFVQGPDLGIDVVYRAPNDVVVAHAGAFNGTGEPVDTESVKGLVYSGRIDINPLGEFPASEANTGQRPLRVGFGAGALFYGSRNYDMAGFEGSKQRDIRASASFRVAVAGLYAQTELLRRQRTDSLSSRPEITTGWYAQASYYTAAALGFAPLARVGWAAEDQGFAERTTVWFEGGLSLYPSVKDPDALRLTLLYVAERRVTEDEQANGAMLQAQLVW